MKIFAHRGCHSPTCPENTLAAFERAVRAGTDGIETDVRMAADGAAILFHDRCLADGTPVASLTREELARRTDREVPTLEEALTQGWDVEWDLELKNADSLRAALPVLKPLVGRVRMFVSSFAHPVVRDAVEALDVEGGLLIYHAPLDADGLGWASDRIPYLIMDIETISDEIVQLSSARGFRAMVYGLITKEDHDVALGLTLEAIITDHPEIVIKAWA
ncbi:MAG: glycerophosphoryl diester phosphodiesterase [Sphingomonadales bacterium]|jgi:glycerophosphoryl diester phosphodiesterase|nr:glycerophosphoryl diester phosphodiesterase [Sphingomonadales bacterium]MEA3045738.1 glycerophosphoryl diester phosphodiesterase [Sphingomonadales bacterium]